MGSRHLVAISLMFSLLVGACDNAESSSENPDGGPPTPFAGFTPHEPTIRTTRVEPVLPPLAKKCRPLEIPNASVTYGDDMRSASIQCNAGFVVAGYTLLTTDLVRCHDGEWLRQVSCVPSAAATRSLASPRDLTSPRTCGPLSVANATVTINQGHTSAHVQCDKGHRIKGYKELKSSSADCRLGKWSVIECDPVAYTPQQRANLAEVNRIIADILHHADEATIRRDLKIFPTPSVGLNAQKVYMYGEDHTSVAGLIAEARALQFLVKPGDIVLVEGVPRGKAVPTMDAARHDVMAIMHATAAAREGKGYDPAAWDQARAELGSLLLPIWELSNIEQLALASADVRGWDDTTRDGASQATRLIRRNESLVGAIGDAMARGRRVHAVVGARHLPEGERVAFLEGFGLAASPEWTQRVFGITALSELRNVPMDRFYSVLAHAAAQDVMWRSFSTTEVVYLFLRDVPHVVLIPKVVFNSRSAEGAED